MKYTHEIIGTHGGALLPERAPGAKSLCVSALMKTVPLLMYSKLDMKAFIHLQKWLITLRSERDENLC